MTDRDPTSDPTPPRRPRPSGPVEYKGEELDAGRGPGLGCFRIQLVVLAVFVALTPLSVAWRWPEAVSAVLLFAVIGLLLTTGQTIIFLLRLVAADRRGRRRPLGSATKTVGELEDAGGAEDAVGAGGAVEAGGAGEAGEPVAEVGGAGEAGEAGGAVEAGGAGGATDRGEP